MYIGVGGTCEFVSGAAALCCVCSACLPPACQPASLPACQPSFNHVVEPPLTLSSLPLPLLQCSQAHFGCLSCENGSGDCLLCDAAQNYYSDGHGGCVWQQP